MRNTSIDRRKFYRTFNKDSRYMEMYRFLVKEYLSTSVYSRGLDDKTLDLIGKSFYVQIYAVTIYTFLCGNIAYTTLAALSGKRGISI
jgi:hypothetical protein